MTKYTSRERILAALNHKEPDRVPVDFGGMRSTGIMAIAYNKLKNYLGIKTGATKVYDLMQQLAEVEPEILEITGADVVQMHRLKPSFGISIKEWKKGELPDGSECLYPKDFNPGILNDGTMVIEDNNGNMIGKRPKNSLYYDFVYSSLAEARSEKDIDNFPWQEVSGEELKFLEEEGKKLKETGKAILFAFGGNILESGQSDWGWNNFMLQIGLKNPLVEYYLDKLADNYIKELKKILPVISKYADIIQCGDDLGTQSDLQLSLGAYREIIKPRQKKVYEFIRNHSDLYLFLHSCGSIHKVIPDLIEIGVQILNPVQTSASGMDPKWLKKEFGEDLVFWGGGCDSQKVLQFGTINEIMECVKDRLQIFMPGGGYVFTPVHNIQADISSEKVVALYKAAQQFGIY